MAKELFSRQSVEGAAWFLPAAYGKFDMREISYMKNCQTKISQGFLVLIIFSLSRWQMMLKLSSGFQAKIKSGQCQEI